MMTTNADEKNNHGRLVNKIANHGMFSAGFADPEIMPKPDKAEYSTSTYPDIVPRMTRIHELSLVFDQTRMAKNAAAPMTISLETINTMSPLSSSRYPEFMTLPKRI